MTAFKAAHPAPVKIGRTNPQEGNKIAQIKARVGTMRETRKLSEFAFRWDQHRSMTRTMQSRGRRSKQNRLPPRPLVLEQ